MKILFFGRKNDEYSIKLLRILRKKFTNVKVFWSQKYNEKLPKNLKNWKGDLIFSFRNYLILPKSLIKNTKIAAINFHPGPPKYRGVGCLNYAIFNNEKFYGVTAHQINSKIDNGSILKVKRFKINQKDDLTKLLNKTHKELFFLALQIINLIKKKIDLKKLAIISKKEKWSKKINNKKDLDNFYRISKFIKKKDLIKKIRSTYTKKFKPYLIIHGKRFIYEKQK